MKVAKHLILCHINFSWVANTSHNKCSHPQPTMQNPNGFWD